ncbi:helix-turn-helix domain-containing protein [Corynebacterium amycolatum]|uniref:helix-turn-helix domain-containing protein n=2 Tax=Corynebacterium TaxID=1716 RepID=UPI001EF436A7|nr:helix-turn-helix domain-containing protein [Corynebacterium amycolatum]MCG7269537.1 helix-turn-helix domain-containing protein [Corynebacterium amycolatum]
MVRKTPSVTNPTAARRGLKPRHMGSVKEAAERWAISEKTIRRMINAGELTGYYPTPRTLRVDMLELDTLLESRATRKVVA